MKVAEGKARRHEKISCIGKQKLTPVAGHGYYSQIAMVSLRAGFSPLFVCRQASRSVLSATRETAAKVVVRQDGSSL